MPLKIVRNDLTRMHSDVIVNPTDPYMSGSGGTDRAVHLAAGPELEAACRALGECRPGEAKLTEAFQLPCKYVIHTVGPVWEGGDARESEILRSCYREALKLADEKGCETAAFPIIAAGTFGYPKEDALRTASEEIGSFLLHSDMTVYLVVYDPDCFRISRSLFQDIRELIDDRFIGSAINSSQSVRPHIVRPMLGRNRKEKLTGNGAAISPAMPDMMEYSLALHDKEEACLSVPPAMGGDIHAELKEKLKCLDESFSQMLLRKIDEKGMTDAECYRKANVDRRLFSKIRSDAQYRPSKATTVAFAIALELSPQETDELLMKAGFAFSPASVFDVIVQLFISRGVYDIFQINETLFAFDQMTLGV